MISTDDFFFFPFFPFSNYNLFVYPCFLTKLAYNEVCVYMRDPLIQSSFDYFRKMARISSSTVDGGLSGGQERIAWFYPRPPSFIRNISVCTLMRCHHPFENMSPRTGTSQCDSIHIIMLSLSQLPNIILITMRMPGIVKILLCLSLSQMQLVLLLYGWKVCSFRRSVNPLSLQ